MALSGSKLVAATFATGGQPGQVAVFDAWTGDKLRDIFRCEYSVIQAVALWDTTLAIVGFGDSVTLVDTTTGVFFDESFEESGELTPGGRARSLAFSPRADGLLAVGGAKVELFDYASRTLVREIERCTPSVDEVAFSPDGAMLAVAEKTSTDDRNGRVAIYLRSPDDAPVREPAPSPTPRPTPMPTSRPTFRPTSSPRDESDGARTASMAWAALLLVAWLA